ncbi:hypothetical protein B0H16DRAFT_1450390 [Mycena metata]|uniref:Uncharacterized protein n=1 Tax=Mycena metata TaxID=1033252 RepID=A0AAD7K172_9AGAR|nr:hypothetical protein B0H16DRAFT_1450390 [Mycena metata]
MIAGSGGFLDAQSLVLRVCAPSHHRWQIKTRELAAVFQGFKFDEFQGSIPSHFQLLFRAMVEIDVFAALKASQDWLVACFVDDLADYAYEDSGHRRLLETIYTTPALQVAASDETILAKSALIFSAESTWVSRLQRRLWVADIFKNYAFSLILASVKTKKIPATDRMRRLLTTEPPESAQTAEPSESQLFRMPHVDINVSLSFATSRPPFIASDGIMGCQARALWFSEALTQIKDLPDFHFFPPEELCIPSTPGTLYHGTRLSSLRHFKHSGIYRNFPYPRASLFCGGPSFNLADSAAQAYSHVLHAHPTVRVDGNPVDPIVILAFQVPHDMVFDDSTGYVKMEPEADGYLNPEDSEWINTNVFLEGEEMVGDAQWPFVVGPFLTKDVNSWPTRGPVLTLDQSMSRQRPETPLTCYRIHFTG